MKKTAAILATTIVAATALAGCGSESPYCEAVKKDQSTLERFGQNRTNADFATYRDTATALSKLAPTAVTKDWTALASAVSDVLAAQKEVGLKLEKVSAGSVSKLTVEQSESLNSSYKSFNAAIAAHGLVVTKDISSECGIKLTTD